VSVDRRLWLDVSKYFLAKKYLSVHQAFAENCTVKGTEPANGEPLADTVGGVLGSPELL